METRQGFVGAITKRHTGTYCLMAGDGDPEHCVYYYLKDEELPQHFPFAIVAALRKLESSEQLECRFIPDFTFKVSDEEKEDNEMFHGDVLNIDDLIDRIPENII